MAEAGMCADTIACKRRGGAMPPTVTLYSAPWCGYCRIAKRFLDEQQVLYTEINIDEDEAAAQRVEQWNQGNRTIPTLDKYLCKSIPVSCLALTRIDTEHSTLTTNH